eukprot:1137793-Pelagomonas_calceolata.AAC.1
MARGGRGSPFMPHFPAKRLTWIPHASLCLIREYITKLPRHSCRSCSSPREKLGPTCQHIFGEKIYKAAEAVSAKDALHHYLLPVPAYSHCRQPAVPLPACRVSAICTTASLCSQPTSAICYTSPTCRQPLSALQPTEGT